MIFSKVKSNLIAVLFSKCEWLVARASAVLLWGLMLWSCELVYYISAKWGRMDELMDEWLTYKWSVYSWLVVSELGGLRSDLARFGIGVL